MGRGLSRGGAAIISVRPSRIKISVATGRTVAAPWWRIVTRIAMVLAGLVLYLGLQYGLAQLIIGEEFYQIMLVGVAVTSFILAITRPALAYAVWIVLSPYGALFFREAISGRLLLSFDRVALMLLLLILTCRALVLRSPPRKLLAGEWLLICWAVYLYVVPELGGRAPIIHAVNTMLQMSVTPLAMYFITKGVVQNKRQLSWIVVAFFIMGMLWAGSGFYEHFAGKSWMNPITEAGWGVEAELGRHDVGKGRAAGPTAHYYTYGEILSLAVLLAFHFSICTKNPAARLFYYACMAFMMIALYYGYSRAPLLAFAAAVLLMPLISRGARAQYVGLALVLLFAVAAIFPIIATDAKLNARFLTSGSFYARQVMLASGINVVKDNFWLGVGPGEISTVLPKYVADPHHQKSESGNYLRPHNDYVVILAEEGIFGFLFYYGAIIALLRAAYRTRAKLPSAGILGKDSATIVIVYAMMHGITSMSDQFQSIPFSSYVLFTLLALGVRLGELQEEDAEAAAKEQGSAHSLPRPAAVVA
jgi:hypothetical protein